MSVFNKGGCAVYEYNDQIKNGTSKPLQNWIQHQHEGRDGFIGWQGFGGSAFQWHPEE